MQNNNQRFSTPAPPRNSEPYDGVLPVDKPTGMTSHDVVDAIRRKVGIKRVGHGGTLDPAATGVLLIMLGRGTKLSNRLMSSDKTYEGTLYLGKETDSQDATGTVTGEGEWEHITQTQLEEEMKNFKGDIYQIPPMVSAVKINGVPLYKHARKGKTVERKPRLVHIYKFQILDFNPPEIKFVLRCTKGTYVRTICNDIGEALGCKAHLSALRRTSAGSMTIEETTPLDDLLKMSYQDLIDKIIPIRNFT
jgi:tRNA pseudouridine55 synthase